MDTRVVIVGLGRLGCLVVGVHKRLGVWSGRQWLSFIGNLLLCSALVFIAFKMAGAVDRGIGRDWGTSAQVAYVIGMMLMLLYGVVSGVQLVRSLASDDVPRKSYQGYLVTFAVLTVVMGLAAALEETHGVSFERSGAVVIGLFSVWLAVRPPEWFDAHSGVPVLQAVLGRRGTQVLYLLAGVLFLAAGILGRPAGLLR